MLKVTKEYGAKRLEKPGLLLPL